MENSDWNFTTYLVSLSNRDALDDTDMQRKGHNLVHREEADPNRVFTELKPAFDANSICSEEQQADGKPLLRFLTIASDDSVFANGDQLETKLEVKDTEEQPMVSWDLNRLTVFGMDTASDNIIQQTGWDGTQQQQDSGHLTRHDFSRFNTAAEDMLTELRCKHKLNEDANDDDFKFPKCIEDQFREMMLRARRQGEWHCKNCGSNMLQGEGPEPQRDTDSHHVHYNQVPFLESSMKKHLELENVNPSDQDTNEQMDSINERREITSEDRIHEDRNLAAKDTIKKSSLPVKAGAVRESVNDLQEENIDELLTFINPDIDVMGKTFHNIPSTQPIYSDNEARNDGNGDESRVRRPMNAFMLWARKYRSLVAKEFSEASNSEISVKLGEIWNELTSEQQRPYFKKAETLKAKHKQNYPNYVYQPRQTFKPVKRNKDLRCNAENEIKSALGVLPLDFGTPFDFFADFKQKAGIVGPHQEQCQGQLNSRTSTENLQPMQHKLTIPKPVYPRNAPTRRVRCNEEIKIDNDNQDEDIVTPTENQGEDENCIKRDLGLVRDAMMPMLERNGDECELVCNSSALNVENVDDFLIKTNSELLAYLENCLKRKEAETEGEKAPKKRAKRNAETKKRGKNPKTKRLNRGVK